MRIAYLAAGAAGMYCGSCLHDNTLAAALRKAGEDILLVPTYTPLRTDEEDVSLPRVFFGGINVYLQQKFPLFRRTPWWLDRVLDRPGVLARLASRASSVSAAELGDMTVSMLQGEHGHQKKELDKLLYWLEQDVRPEVVHLSNALLTGMAPRLKERIGAPVVCSLSGEDIFTEKLTPPYYDQARALLRQNCLHVDAFVALNNYYANYMVEYLGIEPDRIHVIQHGLNLQGHGTRRTRTADEPFTIGYFARVCPDKGLHLLAEAFASLARDTSLPPLRLRVAGYLGPSDRRYLADIESNLHRHGLADRYEYAGQLDRAEKIAFLQSLDVFSVPAVYRESKGISVLEAMANAVPVVVPDHGTYPELIELTGGGVLCRPHDAASLAESLARLIANPQQADEMGRRGQAAIREQFEAGRMAAKTAALYRQVIERAAARPIPSNPDPE
jgi:glycosyltransferase involved in cell wall biosynthesis